MNEKELIAKLKDVNYVRAFGLMSEEEQRIYKEIGINNCEMLSGFTPSRIPIWDSDGLSAFVFLNTYRIKSYYQPLPEYEDIEIITTYIGGHKELGIWFTLSEDKREWIPLYKIPAMPKFKEFWRKGTS